MVKVKKGADSKVVTLILEEGCGHRDVVFVQPGETYIVKPGPFSACRDYEAKA